MNTPQYKYGIWGNDVRINQYVDFTKPYFNDDPYLLIIQFAEVSLRDNQHKEIFSGPVIVRFGVQPTPPTLAIFDRLLESADGHFSVGFDGSVFVHPQGYYAEVTTKVQTLHANFQPTRVRPQSLPDVTIEPLSGKIDVREQ